MTERICPYCKKVIKHTNSNRQKYHAECALKVNAERRPKYASRAEWRATKKQEWLDMDLHEELVKEQIKEGYPNISATIRAIKTDRDQFRKQHRAK